MGKRRLVVAVGMDIEQSPEQLVVDVMGSVGLAGRKEVAIRLNTLCPLPDEPVSLITASRITSGGVETSQSRHDLTENQEGVSTVPASQVLTWRGVPCSSTEPLQEIIVRDGE